MKALTRKKLTEERSDVLIDRLRRVREETRRIVDHLSVEDLNIQALPEVSPPKWHLAHTTWFFETFLLKEFLKDYRVFNSCYEYLFNSYYEGVGEFLEKSKRSILARPSFEEILLYRAYIDESLECLTEISVDPEIWRRIRLGIAHEEQHQELLLTDIKANFFANPIGVAYVDRESPILKTTVPLDWIKISKGIFEIGAREDSFSYDNERPRHAIALSDFEIASRPVTNREYLEFIQDGGYKNPKYWLSDGWNISKRLGWEHPQYWKFNGQWKIFTLAGWKPLSPDEVLIHVSFFEADAFARWAGARLPTESEWEYSSPRLKCVGEAWEWTASPYVAYPGFRPFEGALGEYNRKFMNNQFVLRGGSQVSPPEHVTSTYRNYFQPETRWQYSGIRLAREAQ